ncbi:MAG: hypothetical protein AB3N63_00310 [Puniceicoccaceae bacterium]
MLFWNGNKSPARQQYELEVLRLVLDAVDFSGDISEDRTDYPSAEDEGNIFNTGVDITVTVLGNLKFGGKDKIVINSPIAKGMLGKRLLVIRNADKATFTSIQNDQQMKSLVAGIPATWADAELFRANGYSVAEKGSLEDIFHRLANREFDYVSLGALEVEQIYEDIAVQAGDLCIEPALMLQYPMPLVFYLNPTRKDLADQVHEGLNSIQSDGSFDRLFNDHFGEVVDRLKLPARRTFHLSNPML